MRLWLLLHVLAAIGGVGPEIAFGIMGPRARRAGRAAAAPVYEAIATARARVVYPFLALQVVSGIALLILGRHSVTREAWLGVSLGLYAVAVAIVAAVLVPTSRKARRALTSGVDPGEASMRPLWVRMGAFGSLAGTLLIIVAVLMVLKPGI